jgi:hypothetical protein
MMRRLLLLSLILSLALVSPLRLVIAALNESGHLYGHVAALSKRSSLLDDSIGHSCRYDVNAAANQSSTEDGCCMSDPVENCNLCAHCHAAIHAAWAATVYVSESLFSNSVPTLHTRTVSGELKPPICLHI